MSELRKDLVSIKVNGKEYLCKIAATEYEREQGLMYQESLKDNEGMLFLYPEVQDEISYWMKDTPLDLSIIFIDDDLEIISNQHGEPNSNDIHTEKDVLMVLEILYNPDIKSGQEIDLEDDLEDILENKVFNKGGDYEDFMEKEKEEIESVIEILDTKGKTQYTIEGGERIISRHSSRVLIHKAKRANKLKDDKYYKDLGRYIFNVFKKQDENDPEYVTLEK